MHKLHGPAKVAGAQPWTFETIKRFWLKGSLEGMLIGKKRRGSVKDVAVDANRLTAVRAVRESFRQDFRISRRYMERLQDVKPVRVALLDPVSGMRQPASVWGEACLVPTAKGTHVAQRKNNGKSGIFYNITTLPEGDQQLTKQAPGPQRLTFKDAAAGILRITGMDDPYGSYSAVYPSHVVNEKNEPEVPVRALVLQDDHTMGAAMRLQNATNQLFLSSTLKFKVLITILPGCPNNKGQFHTEEVTPDELRESFPQFRIQDGLGPDYDVYVPASEVTARFAWRRDKEAEKTITKLLGLDDPDPTTGGLIDEKGHATRSLPGFTLVNVQRELYNHSRAVAAETYTSFADTVVGKVATIVPPNDIELRGNMGGAPRLLRGHSVGQSARVHVRRRTQGRARHREI